MNRWFCALMALALVLATALLIGTLPSPAQVQAPHSADLVALGRAIFFDQNLSKSGTMGKLEGKVAAFAPRPGRCYNLTGSRP